MTLSEFIAMGGYGGYVWSAYAICAAVLVVNIAQPVWRERKTRRALKKRLAALQSPGSASKPGNPAPGNPAQ